MPSDVNEIEVDRDGDGDGDADMDFEEMDDFPDGHTPGWSDLSSISDDDVESFTVLMKGRGLVKRASLISVGVSQSCRRGAKAEHRIFRLAMRLRRTDRSRS